MQRKLTRKRPNLLLGLGLDDTDGHTRITKGPDFRLLGGSKPTHEKMQELALKTRERLKQQGKTIATASPREVSDTLDTVAHKLGLHRADEPPPSHD